MSDRPSGSFERARRIVKTDEFSSVFRLKPVFRTAHLALYVRPNMLAHARLGVVAAKRLAPRAVTRNAVKRAVREAYRQSELLRSLGLDCVVRLSAPIGSKADPARSTEIQQLLHSEVLVLFNHSVRLTKIAESAKVANTDSGDAE